MRCDSCHCNQYDYSEGYDTCWLGIEPYENSKGSIGCKYRQSTIDKWCKEAHDAEDRYYADMCKAIEAVEGKPIDEVTTKIEKVS